MFNHIQTIEPVALKSVDGPKGRFYTTPDGNKYPSITTVLGHGDKTWLTEWRNSLGIMQADKETKRAAERGTAVHLMLERFINNDPNPTEGQNFAHINEFNSLKNYIRKIDNVLAQEIALYSDTVQVAGRVDCIAEYNGRLSIIDFKTSNNSKSEAMIHNYYQQTAFYAVAFGEMYDILIEDIVIIMSVEKGIPLIFKAKVADWIEPLVKTISAYHVATC